MFKEIPDALWEKVQPLLAPFQRRRPGGKKPLAQRQVLNGILYVLITGCQWSMLPRCYGSKSSVHEHFQCWVSAGVFDQVLLLCLEYYDELKGIDWQWQSMDGCLLQAPGCSKDPEEGVGSNPTDRGRPGTKWHPLVDEQGIPLCIQVCGANVHDSRLVSSTVAALVIEMPDPPETSHPETSHPETSHLCLDKAYDYPRVHEEVASLGYQAHIKQRGIQEEATCLPDGTRYPARRWVVERTFAWLKAYRGIRTRFTRKLANYQALVHLACALLIFGKAVAQEM